MNGFTRGMGKGVERTGVALGVIALLALSAAARASDDEDEHYALSEQATESRQFELNAPDAPRRVTVDNVFGAIRVVGTAGSTVRLVAHETWRADTKDDLAQAHKDIRLDLQQTQNTVRVYVDGPFRCNCKCGEGFHSDNDRDYRVTYDFELEVPADASLKLRTVNEGRIAVSGVAGDYDISNVNGPIELGDISGSGRAHTVNGGVTATFRANPKANSSFGTINGDLRLNLVRGVSADFYFKTFNGDIFTDFPMTAIAAPQPVADHRGEDADRRNKKFVYRSSRFSGGRVGGGGPQIKLDGFNSNIYILERKS